MLNRKEYNATFKTKLTQEQFDEIMGKPVSDISDIEELVLADKKGNAWYFLPKEKAIPIEWIKSWAIKNWVKTKKCEFDIIVSKLIEDWQGKENENNH